MTPWRSLGTPAAALLLMACGSDSGQQPASPPTAEANGPREWGDVLLELELEIADDPNRNRPNFWTSLSNRGDDEVVVVLPGDGSPLGWRTPIVEWIVETEGGERLHSVAGARCGNINPLTADEIVTLLPGDSVSLDRYGMSQPQLPTTGTYQVSLRYTNDPDLEWSGIPLGLHESDAMKRLRASTPCTVVSNAVRVQLP